ncbi:MAG: hypothetical protein WA209_19520 [Candidatus Acidiferrales bacterium]
MIKRFAQSLAVLGLFVGMIACGGGGGGSKQTVTIVISAPSATAVVGTPLQFTANVTGTTDTAVTWQVNGVPGGTAATGTISASGSYLATVLPSPVTVTITGVSQADATKASSIQITVQNSSSNITVNVTPSGNANVPFTIETFAKQTFTATVTGTTNTAVTWSIRCQSGGTACGAIGSTGNYVAPNSVPTFIGADGSVTNDLVIVTATSQANPAAVGTSTVYIKPLNQNALSAPVQLGSSGSSVGATCLSGNSGFCFGGTLGSLITRAGVSYIMSNNHVLGLSDAATAGQAITQPGEIETNCQTAGTITVANFTSYIPLQPQPTTPVDVAIAQIISGEVDANGNVLELGAISNGIPQPGQVVSGSGMAASIGETIAKSGRTTGLTCSSVESIATSVEIGYEKGCATTTSFSVLYKNQVTVGQTANGNNFIAEGDSGSLAVDESTATPVALMFAGGDTTAVGNPISAVLTALNNGSAATFVGTGTKHAIAGCSLPAPTADGVIAKGSNAPAATASLSASVTQAALSAQDRNAADLMNLQGVSAVGTGASLDSPAQAAMLVFVPRGSSVASIPAQINGVRTRVVESDTNLRGSLSGAQTAQLMTATNAITVSLTDAQVSNAISVKEAHVGDLMAHQSVQGVGVAASLDAPGEPAIMIYVLKGQPHDFIPTTLDGIRTRIKETTPFQAGVSNPVKAAACKIPKQAAKSPANTSAGSKPSTTQAAAN